MPIGFSDTTTTRWRGNLASHGVTYLRFLITAWAIAIIIAVWIIDNPWVLAGILLYEVLP